MRSANFGMNVNFIWRTAAWNAGKHPGRKRSESIRSGRKLCSRRGVPWLSRRIIILTRCRHRVHRGYRPMTNRAIVPRNEAMLGFVRGRFWVNWGSFIVTTIPCTSYLRLLFLSSFTLSVGLWYVHADFLEQRTRSCCARFPGCVRRCPRRLRHTKCFRKCEKEPWPHHTPWCRIAKAWYIPNLNYSYLQGK